MLADRVILICTVAIATIYLLATTQIPTLEIGDPLGPKAFPDLLGIALLIAAGMLGLELWRDREKSPEQTERLDKHVMCLLAGVIALTGIYYFVFETLGFIVATSIYLMPMMAYFNRGKWITNGLSGRRLLNIDLCVVREARSEPAARHSAALSALHVRSVNATVEMTWTR